MLGQQSRKAEATEKEGRKCPCVVMDLCALFFGAEKAFLQHGTRLSGQQS